MRRAGALTEASFRTFPPLAAEVELPAFLLLLLPIPLFPILLLPLVFLFPAPPKEPSGPIWSPVGGVSKYLPGGIVVMGFDGGVLLFVRGVLYVCARGVLYVCAVGL